MKIIAEKEAHADRAKAEVELMAHILILMRLEMTKLFMIGLKHNLI